MADKKVKPRDTIKVYGTGNSSHIAKGVELVVHKIPAETLVAKGFVTYDKPEAGEGGKGKKKD